MNRDRRWNDPGILRKKAKLQTDLFVFGYACKIFRDDDKALEMDQGKHLIPWMGDDLIKIDRYDARGHLSELSQFERGSETHFPSLEERRIEFLCDDERYHALYHNEEEQEMYQEEELKRLKQALSSDKAYGQVAYQYTDTVQTPAQESESVSVCPEEDLDPFVPSPFLDIPTNMLLPTTTKENQIIEKTATHVASHGPQVEILIKTRQANNQKLNFLHVGSPLNPYYNFILQQIKTGRYRPGSENHLENDTNHDDHYLHPSLAAPSSTSVESAPSIPSIAYKPSSDCLYRVLVNNIKNMQENKEISKEETAPPVVNYDMPLYPVAPSSSSIIPPIKRKHKRRHHSSTDNGPKYSQLPAKQKPNSDFPHLPPKDIREVMSRLIKFALDKDLDPYEIGAKMLKKDCRSVGFVKPGHKYHDYFIRILKEDQSNRKFELLQSKKKRHLSRKENHNESGDNDSDTPATMSDLNPTYDAKKNNSASVQQEQLKNKYVDGILIPGETRGIISAQIEDSNKAEYTSPDSVHPQITSSSSDWDVPPPKPAPISFSIKKPRENERLECASAFPLEESTSGDEEVVIKEPLLKSIEIEKQKLIEREKEQVSNSAEEQVKEKLAQTTCDYDNLTVKEKDRYRKSNKTNGSVVNGNGEQHSNAEGIDEGKHAKTSEKQLKGIIITSKPLPTESHHSKTKERDFKSPKSHRISSSGISARRDSSGFGSRERHKKRRDHHHHKELERKKSKDIHSKSTAKKRLDVFLSLKKESAHLRHRTSAIMSPTKENDEKLKHEDRKKRVKEMIAKLIPNETTENRGKKNQTCVTTPTQVASPLPFNRPSTSVAMGLPIVSTGTFLPFGPCSMLNDVQKTKFKVKTKDPEDVERNLRQQVKKLLREIARTSLAEIPTVVEENTSTQAKEDILASSDDLDKTTPSSKPVLAVNPPPIEEAVEVPPLQERLVL